MSVCFAGGFEESEEVRHHSRLRSLEQRLWRLITLEFKKTERLLVVVSCYYTYFPVILKNNNNIIKIMMIINVKNLQILGVKKQSWLLCCCASRPHTLTCLQPPRQNRTSFLLSRSSFLCRTWGQSSPLLPIKRNFKVMLPCNGMFYDTMWANMHL